MELSEVAPPGFGHTKGDKKKGVEKGGTAAAFDRARKEGRFKGSKSDMFAIMWSQKNKGDKPHYKPGTNKKYKKYQEEETSCDSSYEKLKKKIGSKKKHKKPVIVGEDLTGDMKTDLEKYRVPRGPGGNPKRIGDKVRSMSEKQPLGKLKIKYGAEKVRDYYKKNKGVDEGVSYGYKGKKYVKLPDKVRAKTRWGGDARSDEGKLKDAITDKLGLTNTKKHGVLSNEEIQGGISMQDYDPNMKFRDYEFIDVIKAEPLKKTIKEDYAERRAQDRQKFVDFYKKAKAAKAKKQSDAVRTDSKKHGIKFTDSRGSGRMRGGKKHYD